MAEHGRQNEAPLGQSERAEEQNMHESDGGWDDDRQLRAGARAVATMAAFDDREVAKLHHEACVALAAFAMALQEHDVEIGQIVGQLHQCAISVFLKGIGAAE